MAKKVYTKVPGRPFKPGAANPGHASLRPKTGAGRKKGTPNKFSRDIREAVINALERLGGDDYLVKLGKQEKKAFAQLIGKAMPMQVEGSGNKARPISVGVTFVAPPEPEDKE